MYIAAALHTILECRRCYIPRGVAKDPGWSLLDTLTFGLLAQRLLEYSETTVGDMVLKFRGLLNNVVYSVMT